MIRFDIAHPAFPTLLRVFGDYPIKNLDLIPNVFLNHLYFLTTDDYEELNELKRRFGTQVIHTEFSQAMAVRNSGAFLNTGIRRIREDNHDQVLLIASGYEMSLPRIIGSIDKAKKQFEEQDIIYFLLPGIHYDNQFPDRVLDIVSDIGLVFPSESLAWLDLKSFKCFDTELSEKGTLGYTDKGIPLGGIELMITITKDFAQNGVSPRMTGIISNILRGKVDPNYFDEFGNISTYNPESIEATSGDIKIERRILTIEAVRERIGLSSDENFQRMFANLCILGEYDLSTHRSDD